MADVFVNGTRSATTKVASRRSTLRSQTAARRPQLRVIYVNNQLRGDGVPPLNTDWWNYGGITRPVMLVETPETFIQDYSIQLDKGSTHRLQGWLQLNGPRLQQEMTIRIPEARVDKKLRTDAKGRADFSFDTDLTLWSPENPKLYTVEISSETDRVTDRIGFRSIEVRGTDILLNGKPVFLRGIDMHEEAPTRPGRSWSDDDARTLLGWVKELGCNFVRLAHYPHNEAMLRMADQMGVMVWGEIPFTGPSNGKIPIRSATPKIN